MVDAILFALFLGLVFALTDQKIIKALPGQNVTLPCQAPNNAYAIAVKWTRVDLGSDYVIFDKNGMLDYENQHSTFENRVNLQDRQNGNISLVLTNVSTNDSGTYECQVFQNATGLSWKNISTIILEVGLPAQRNESREDKEKKKKENNDGSNGLVVVDVVGIVVIGIVVVIGIGVVVGIVGVVVGAIIPAIIKYKPLKRNTNQPLPTQAAEP